MDSEDYKKKIENLPDSKIKQEAKKDFLIDHNTTKEDFLEAREQKKSMILFSKPEWFDEWSKSIITEEDKKREQEQKKIELAMKVSNRTGLLASARLFLEEQPIYYDENRIWWLWDTKEYRWKITDETTVINLITEINKLLGDSGVKHKNLIIEAIKQEARKAKPKEPDKNIIQFKDKFYNIKTKEITTATPQYFCVNPIPWNIGDNEETPVIDTLFTQWVGEQWKNTLYELLAYSCYSDYPIQFIFGLSGGGRNGKTQYQKLLVNFLGLENTCSTELDTITNPNKNFERFSLYRKLVCLMGETSYESLRDTSLLKKLTGGDLISFQKKYADPFNAYNYAKIIINTNGLPDSHDKSDGYYRRWLIIDFPNQFPEGKDIIDTIPQIEYNNLAKKITRILPEILQKGEITNQGTMEERKTRYELRANPLMEFVKEYCTQEDNYFIKYSNLFTKYTHWLNLNKKRVVSRKEFTDILTRNGFEIDKTSKQNEKGIYESGMWILGLKFKDQIPEFETPKTYGNDVLNVLDVTTFPINSYKRSNYEHIEHIEHMTTTARLNDGVSIQDVDNSILSKAGVLSVIKNATKVSYGDLEFLYPKVDIKIWVDELKKEGLIFEMPAGILNILQ